MHINPFAIVLDVLQTWASQGGYVFLFFMSVAEALPLVGTVVPGHSAVMVSGFLAQLGVLNIWAVIAIASAGAVLGDLIGFYLGRFYGIRLIEKYKKHFFFKEEYLDRTRMLISKHTGQALLLGRFNPLTRALAPFVVGTNNTNIKKFWFYNVIGGISWATISVLVGYSFGYGYHAAAGVFGKAAMFATVISILVIWGYRFVNIRFHIFRKYELFVLFLAVISLFSLFQTIQDAWAFRSYMASFDVTVNVFMATHIPIFVAKIAEWISYLGSPSFLAVIGLSLGIWFISRSKIRSGFICVFGTVLTLVSTGLMKDYFLRIRPENALQNIFSDPSFPSGHAAMSAALCLIVVYLFAPKIRFWMYRELFIVLCVLLAMAIGMSRVVINVHWASDVIAGWSLGFFVVASTILMIRYIGALVVKRIEA